MVVGRDAAHVVVHGRQHRDRLARHVHVGKDARRLGDARQALVQRVGAQVLQVQHDVVLVRTAAATFQNLHRHGARDDIARGQILGARRVALHEALAGRVGQVPALTARAFGDQTARRVDAGRVELHHLHVLQRHADARRQRHAVAGADVRRRAGLVGPPVAAGGEHHGAGEETMQAALDHVIGDHADDAPGVVRHEVDGEELDEELRLVLQRLLVQRVQHGVTGAVSGGAGALRRRLVVRLVLAAERALINLAVLGARERHAGVFELDHRRDGLLAHVLDGVLVAQPVRALHGVVEVVAPVVVHHVAERGVDAALRRHGVRAGREHLGKTRHRQVLGRHAEGGAKAGAAGANDHHVEAVIGNLLLAAHALKTHCPNITRSTATTAVAPRPTVSTTSPISASRLCAGTWM